MRTKQIATILAAPLLAAALSAQAPKTQAVLMAMGANGKQMVAWQWKQRTTIVRRGNPAGVKIDEIHFDATGQPQRVTLSQPQEKRMGPLMARKANETKTDVQEVMQLAGRYANPRELAQAIQKGEIWEGQSGMRVQARAVILPVDDVSIGISRATFL